MLRLIPSILVLIVVALISGALVRSGSEGGEAGQIAWQGDMSAAGRLARQSGKPLMIFHAGPGQSGRRAGAEVLGHPIVADASDEFIPVMAPAADGPRVTFQGVDGRALEAEESTNFSVPSLLRRMREALRTAGRPSPVYLDLVAFEYNPVARQSAAFAVGCYWKGERHLGALPGVVATRTGFVGADEVVQIEFDPTSLSYEALSRRASQIECFKGAVGPSGDPSLAVAVRPADDPKFNLSQHPEYALLPLTELQTTKVNAALGDGGSPDPYLSPSQLVLLRQMQQLLAVDDLALQSVADSLRPDRTTAGLAAYADLIRLRIACLR